MLKLTMLFASILTLTAGLTQAQAAPAPQQAAATKADPCDATGAQIVFDHFKENADRSFSLTLRVGESLKILVKDTAVGSFTYEISGIPISTAQDSSKQAAGDIKESDLSCAHLEQKHESQYGGYIIKIRRKPAVPSVSVVKADGTKQPLNEVTLIVAVVTSKWNAEFAGAFTVSNLREPVYALETRNVNGTDKQFVIENTEKRDSARLGMAAFIHTYHDRLPWLAATFGLGINDGSKPAYYVGPTLRFGDKLGFTAGPVWGSVQRLKAGIQINTSPVDSNALTDLPTSIKRGWFFGLSYTFINTKDIFTKPFKGSEDQKK